MFVISCLELLIQLYLYKVLARHYNISNHFEHFLLFSICLIEDVWCKQLVLNVVFISLVNQFEAILHEDGPGLIDAHELAEVYPSI